MRTRRVRAAGGEFTAMHNIAVDHQGNIFTAEVTTGQRVQKLRRLDQQQRVAHIPAKWSPVRR